MANIDQHQKQNENQLDILSATKTRQPSATFTGVDRTSAMLRILNQNSRTSKRVSTTYFTQNGKILVPYTNVLIVSGNILDEDEFIRINCERGHWCRTRYEDRTVYLFEDETDAMFLKMRFG